MISFSGIHQVHLINRIRACPIYVLHRVPPVMLFKIISYLEVAFQSDIYIYIYIYIYICQPTLGAINQGALTS